MEQWWRRKSSYSWLSAPLVVAVVTVALANYLVPTILSRSERHQKALEIKTALAQQISHAQAAVVARGQLFARGVTQKEDLTSQTRQAIFDQALLEWRVNSEEISSELRAYFPGKPITDEWATYSQAVEDLYFLSSTGIKSDRCPRARRVKNLVEPTGSFACPKADPLGTNCRRAPSNPPWAALVTCDADEKGRQYSYARGENYTNAYLTVSGEVVDKGRALTAEMLHLTPSGFSSRLPLKTPTGHAQQSERLAQAVRAGCHFGDSSNNVRRGRYGATAALSGDAFSARDVLAGVLRVSRVRQAFA
jgi:hypothetical protein